MMCLALWTPCLASNQVSSAGIRIERGAAAPFTGYLFTESVARDIAQGWKDAEMQVQIISRAYEDLKRETLESANALNAEIITLNNALLGDARKARRERRRKNFWQISTAVIIGGVIGIAIHNNK